MNATTIMSTSKYRTIQSGHLKIGHVAVHMRRVCTEQSGESCAGGTARKKGAAAYLDVGADLI